MSVSGIERNFLHGLIGGIGEIDLGGADSRSFAGEGDFSGFSRGAVADPVIDGANGLAENYVGTDRLKGSIGGPRHIEEDGARLLGIDVQVALVGKGEGADGEVEGNDAIRIGRR